jgi:alkylated DNA repair dioxygenase AlkB
MKGLTYIPAYLTPEEHEDLLNTIDKAAWSTELKRRVQHYGYNYDYRKRSIDASMVMSMPEWARQLVARVTGDGYTLQQPDQLIVNEYLAGQGISPHVDCEPCFGNVIVVISLGSDYVMDFRHRESSVHAPLLLQSRSLMVMSGEARYEWTHGIAARRQDVIEGRTIKRGRRVSLTMRNVIF